MEDYVRDPDWQALQTPCPGMPAMVFQIWQDDNSTPEDPVQLYYGVEDEDPFTCDVILPQSKKPVWLPLVKQDASGSNDHSSMSWNQLGGIGCRH